MQNSWRKTDGSPRLGDWSGASGSTLIDLPVNLQKEDQTGVLRCVAVICIFSCSTLKYEEL